MVNLIGVGKRDNTYVPKADDQAENLEMSMCQIQINIKYLYVNHTLKILKIKMCKFPYSDMVQIYWKDWILCDQILT